MEAVPCGEGEGAPPAQSEQRKDILAENTAVSAKSSF